MLRNALQRPLSVLRSSLTNHASRWFAVAGPSQEVPTIKNMQLGDLVHIDDSSFSHQRGPRFSNYTKFKSPRKRVNILMEAIRNESQARDREHKPAVWGVDFRVGDAVEIDYVPQGGVNGKDREKLRGVILGRHNRGMDTAIYLRDVVYGEPVERKIPLHNPMVKSVNILEHNFVFKGKRKIKRAKLYYIRERKPAEYRVTGVFKQS